MLVKYSYLTDDYSTHNGEYKKYGSFQCDVEDFKNFWAHRNVYPEKIVYVFIQFADGLAYTWNDYSREWTEIKEKKSRRNLSWL